METAGDGQIMCWGSSSEVIGVESRGCGVERSSFCPIGEMVERIWHWVRSRSRMQRDIVGLRI